MNLKDMKIGDSIVVASDAKEELLVMQVGSGKDSYLYAKKNGKVLGVSPHVPFGVTGKTIEELIHNLKKAGLI